MYVWGKRSLSKLETVAYEGVDMTPSGKGGSGSSNGKHMVDGSSFVESR